MNVYVHLVRGGIVHRTEALSDGVNMDFGEGGELIGIEIIGAEGLTAESED